MTLQFCVCRVCTLYKGRGESARAARAVSGVCFSVPVIWRAVCAPHSAHRRERSHAAGPAGVFQRSSQLRAVSARHRKTDSAFPYLPTRTAMPSNLSRRARGACAVSHARAERVLYATRLQRAEKLGCVGCGPTATPSLCRYGDAKPLGTQHREAGAGPLRDELRQAQCGAGARLVGLGFGWG